MMSENMQQNEDGNWAPAVPIPEPWTWKWLRHIRRWWSTVRWRMGYPRFKVPACCHTCGTSSTNERDHLGHFCREPDKAFEYRETIDRLRAQIEVASDLDTTLDRLMIDCEDDAGPFRVRHCISWNNAIEAVREEMKGAD